LRSLALVVGLALLSGCPESIAQQCPARTTPVGQFALALTGKPDAGTACVQTLSDGGAIPFTLGDAGTTAGALCYSQPGATAAQLYYVAAGKGARPSDLLADGGFHFVGHTDPTPGICNGCTVTVDETFDGFIQSGATGAPFVVQPDGGLPPVTSLVGTLVDSVSSPTGGCQCNVPCTITYSVTGSPF
jgi:hypothetical protein